MREKSVALRATDFSRVRKWAVPCPWHSGILDAPYPALKGRGYHLPSRKRDGILPITKRGDIFSGFDGLGAPWGSHPTLARNLGRRHLPSSQSRFARRKVIAPAFRPGYDG